MGKGQEKSLTGGLKSDRTMRELLEILFFIINMG